MTDTQETAATAEEPKAPAGHYYATMKERRILVKEISPAQSMVLGGLLRNHSEGRTVEHHLAVLGKLMRLVEALVPSQEDLDWMEGGILDGVFDVADFASIFWPVTQETVAVKKKTVRRGR